MSAILFSLRDSKRWARNHAPNIGKGMPRLKLVSAVIPGLVVLCLLFKPSFESIIVDSKFRLDESENASGKIDSSVSGIQKSLAVIALIWYTIVLALAYSGWVEIVRKFRSTKFSAASNQAQEAVSIIRPVSYTHLDVYKRQV